MTGRREHKKQLVRQSLFDTAIALFEAEGYDAVSVDRIVAEAGVAKGTF
ncbi:helix-turn-helix domain-containing protein, partial [Marinicauda pacifica]